MKYIKTITALLLLFILVSCGNNTSKITTKDINFRHVKNKGYSLMGTVVNTSKKTFKKIEVSALFYFPDCSCWESNMDWTNGEFPPNSLWSFELWNTGKEATEYKDLKVQVK
jgi:hypothetical protein